MACISDHIDMSLNSDVASRHHLTELNVRALDLLEVDIGGVDKDSQAAHLLIELSLQTGLPVHAV
jgi:hypothetical protein